MKSMHHKRIVFLFALVLLLISACKSQPPDRIYAYQSDIWQRLQDMPVGLLGKTVSMVDGDVYIIGGSASKYPQKPYLADVLVYSPDQ